MYHRLFHAVLVALCISSFSLSAPNPGLLPKKSKPTRSISTKSTSHSTASHATSTPTSSLHTTKSSGTKSTSQTSTSKTRSNSNSDSITKTNSVMTSPSHSTTSTPNVNKGTNTATTGTHTTSSADSKSSCPARSSSSSSQPSKNLGGKLSPRDGTKICDVSVRKKAECKNSLKFNRQSGPSSESKSSSTPNAGPQSQPVNPSGKGGKSQNRRSDHIYDSIDNSTTPEAKLVSRSDDESDSDSSGLSEPPESDIDDSQSESEDSDNDHDDNFEPDSSQDSEDHNVLEPYECEHTIELQFAKAVIEKAGVCDLLDKLNIDTGGKQQYIQTLIDDKLLYSQKNLYDVVKSVNGEKRALTARFIKNMDSKTIPLIRDKSDDPDKLSLWISVKMYITFSRVATNVKSLLAPLDNAIEKLVQDAGGCPGPKAKSSDIAKAKKFKMPQQYKMETLWERYVGFIERQADQASSPSSKSDSGGGSKKVQDSSTSDDGSGSKRVKTGSS
ncbi:hypothetical protein VKT23_017438 [Stygiomarasmius scandens]|uniref:Uncharacterized protein n=1 Tax=Marasmiellus scandens TaxID=2682957 RepID=A0ABR1IWM5_9AGAR